MLAAFIMCYTLTGVEFSRFDAFYKVNLRAYEMASYGSRFRLFISRCLKRKSWDKRQIGRLHLRTYVLYRMWPAVLRLFNPRKFLFTTETVPFVDDFFYTVIVFFLPSSSLLTFIRA